MDNAAIPSFLKTFTPNFNFESIFRFCITEVKLATVRFETSFLTNGTSPKFSTIIPLTPAFERLSMSFCASSVISSRFNLLDGEPGKPLRCITPRIIICYILAC